MDKKLTSIVFVWFNDTKKAQYVSLYDFNSKPLLVKPQNAIELSIDIPESSKLFMKVWETGVVLVSFMS